MSIYATHWVLKFPTDAAHRHCEWVTVYGQAVPAHVGSPTPGQGYEDGDPYADFLPPAVAVPEGYTGRELRAMVVVTEHDTKDIQRYRNPLLVLSGDEYAALSFDEVHDRVRDALRRNRPRIVVESQRADGSVRLRYSDGTTRFVPARPDETGE